MQGTYAPAAGQASGAHAAAATSTDLDYLSVACLA
jgi:hypothetical protein